MSFFLNTNKNSLPPAFFSISISGLKTTPIHYPNGINEGANIVSCIKYFFQHPEEATQDRLDSLWRQVKDLEHKSWRHSVQENAVLYMAAAFFQDEKFQKKVSRRLYSQLDRYKPKDISELSETIELLLDCINIGERMAVNGARLRDYTKPMLKELNSNTSPDITSPDTSAVEQLNDYAQRLYITWQ